MDAASRKGGAEKVLVVAPSVHDAEAAGGALAEAGIPSEAHDGGPSLEERLGSGVSALLIAQEALLPETVGAIARALGAQPAWSDLPLIVMTAPGMQESPTSAAVRDLLPSGNVTLLERPFGRVVFLSAVRVALRARRRQHQFRTLFERGRAVKDTVAQGLYTVDAEGRVTYINGAAEAMFGWKSAELIGRKMHEATHFKHPDGSPFPAEECAGLRVLRDREVLRDHEDVFIRKDGTFFPVVFSAAPLLEDGVPMGIVVTFSDQTERRQREAERLRLLESERAARAESERANRLKDDFLATLSHELRTPINAILGWAHLLRGASGDSAKVARGVEVIERNARAQSQLISDLLDMSRILSGKMRLEVRPVDLPAVVEAAIETVRPAAEANGIRVERLIEPGAGPVHGDPGRLQQVAWNLLANAVKFTARGGRVQVEVARAGSSVRLRVSDNGRGIGADFLPHVFERFRQADSSTAREHGGLGLGLAIVRQLVELHGGTVEAASPGEGKGATFTVNLPVAIVHGTGGGRGELPQQPHGVSTGPELAGVRVLVVDDEADARDVVKRILEERHADVVVAGSADEGLDAIRRRSPDVLVSDIGMPGEDGYEFISRVRADGHGMPAAALTAFARSEDRSRVLLSGYQMHIAKPVEPTELVAAVAALALPERRAAAGPGRSEAS